MYKNLINRIVYNLIEKSYSTKEWFFKIFNDNNFFFDKYSYSNMKKKTVMKKK